MQSAGNYKGWTFKPFINTVYYMIMMSCKITSSDTILRILPNIHNIIIGWIKRSILCNLMSIRMLEIDWKRRGRRGIATRSAAYSRVQRSRSVTQYLTWQSWQSLNRVKQASRQTCGLADGLKTNRLIRCRFAAHIVSEAMLTCGKNCVINACKFVY